MPPCREVARERPPNQTLFSCYQTCTGAQNTGLLGQSLVKIFPTRRASKKNLNATKPFGHPPSGEKLSKDLGRNIDWLQEQKLFMVSKGLIDESWLFHLIKWGKLCGGGVTIIFGPSHVSIAEQAISSDVILWSLLQRYTLRNEDIHCDR